MKAVAARAGVEKSERASFVRLPAGAVRRERISSWLNVLAGGSARLFVAPTGFGKSTILRQVAAEFGDEALYVRFVSGRSFVECIRHAIATPLGADESVARLSTYRAVLFDDVEHLRGADEHRLNDVIEQGRVRNLIMATSRVDVVRSEHIVSGLVSICTERLLAFDAKEIQAAAALLKLPLTDVEALEMRERSEGWPLAVTGALRTAAAFALSAYDGLERWKMDQRLVILDLFEDQVSASLDLLEIWTAVLENRYVSPQNLRRLEGCGAPVLYREGRGYTMLRVVREMHAGSADRGVTGVLRVRMFGTFDCSLEGRQVQWLRRMERRVMRYLLLTRDGTESKERLLELFWPGQDPAAALQSLRTTCSNIKKALGQVVGPDDVGSYFSAGDRIGVNLEHVTIDVRRFIAHVRSGNSANATDAWEEALHHYRQADVLYTAHLGWGDEPEDWLDDLARECRSLRMHAMRTSVDILKRLGRTDEAGEYEMLLAERSKRHE